MTFSWTDRELNNAQSGAVLEDGSVFLVACPGSGKTRTLTYKIAYELSRLKSQKKFIVAFTYTNRAAEEIQERIENLGVDTSRLWIGTIHAFCLEWILKPYAIYEPDLAHGFQIMDGYEQDKLVDSLCKELGVKPFHCGYYVTEDGYELSCRESYAHKRLYVLYQQYFAYLAANRLIDFEQILHYAWKLLRSKPEIAKLLANLFPLILVDEYQDTKKIQYSILGAILRAGEGRTKIFVVGDPNQAIYGSLGGFAMSVSAFKKLTGLPIAERELSGNYRSSKRIIDYFSNYNVFPTKIYAASTIKAFPSIVTYDQKLHETEVVGTVVKLIKQALAAGTPQNQICVLAPWWIHLAPMTRRLVAALPDCEFDGPGMVPFSRDFENFWYRLTRIALTQASPAQYARRRRWATEVIRDLDSVGVSVAKLTPKILLRESNGVKISEQDGLLYLAEYFDTLMEKLEIDWRSYPLLVNHHTGFFEGAEARLKKLDTDAVNFRSIDFFRKVFRPRCGINVNTIHGVKGAEFDVVIAYGLLEGLVPNDNDEDGDATAKKMLYVIGSRAKKHLHLMSENGRTGRGRALGPTEVLEECRFPYDPH